MSKDTLNRTEAEWKALITQYVKCNQLLTHLEQKM